MGKSHMASSFALANSLQIMCNSQCTDTATVWFNILNSQLGTTAKHLISTSFQFGPASCFLHIACSHSGVLLYQHCWCWEHSTRACQSQASQCPQYASPYTKTGHHQHTSYCRGNLSACPLQDPTPKGAPCPHAICCVNCKGDHSASNQQCPYWHHYFDQAWLSEKTALSERTLFDNTISQKTGEEEHKGRRMLNWCH
ncbi:hypothetical protein AN958_02768 [Leucoagaricus sp. SymC.cos]|nr:hypothetical protein AN958_02768 [Leucoagaricus sp. SymC.cos]